MKEKRKSPTPKESKDAKKLFKAGPDLEKLCMHHLVFSSMEEQHPMDEFEASQLQRLIESIASSASSRGCTASNTTSTSTCRTPFTRFD